MLVGDGTPLDELPISVFDCQTTGASPAHGHLTEVAWSILAPGRIPPVPDIHSFLVALPHGASVPARIQRITGIDEEMLEGGIQASELARLVLPVISDAVPMAHYASFEGRWIGHLLSGHLSVDTPPLFICTREIARRLHPAVPRKGIRALAGYMGHCMGERRRASDHVLATVRIWGCLRDDLLRSGIGTLGKLRQYLDRPPPSDPVRFDHPLPRKVRLALPDRPGVYRLLSADGSVLYTGKASSLKSRVNSYFTRRKGPGKILELVSQVHDVQVSECETPLESALLEFDSIRELDPPYNVALRDREERICLLSLDLGTVIHEQVDEPVWGPVRESSPALLLAGVLEAMEKGDVIPPGRLGLDHLPLEEGAIEEGFRDFGMSIFPDGEHSLGRLLAAGRRMWMERREERSGEDGLEDPGEDAGAPKEEIDAEGVMKHLAWIAASGTRDLLRGAWFRLLGWSTLSWEPRGGCGTRVLRMSRGEVAAARWVSKEGDIGGVRTPERPLAGLLDPRVYGRLRVLDSELRRITCEGTLRSLLPGEGAGLGIEGMSRLYEHV